MDVVTRMGCRDDALPSPTVTPSLGACRLSTTTARPQRRREAIGFSCTERRPPERSAAAADCSCLPPPAASEALTFEIETDSFERFANPEGQRNLPCLRVDLMNTNGG